MGVGGGVFCILVLISLAVVTYHFAARDYPFEWFLTISLPTIVLNLD